MFNIIMVFPKQTFNHLKLSYKVKVFNASKRSKFTVRQLQRPKQESLADALAAAATVIMKA